MIRSVNTHQSVGAKDGLAEWGELDGHHGNLPETVVLYAGATEGSGDDLVAEADAWMEVWGWDGNEMGDGLPNTFRDGLSVTIRLTYATSLLIHSMSS